jgi:hypothetical protein
MPEHMTTNTRKHVNYNLYCSTLALLTELRDSSGLTNALVISEGVKLLKQHPEVLRDLHTADACADEGKKAKVFKLPTDVTKTIAELAGEQYPRSHVVDLAIRLFSDRPPTGIHVARTNGSQLLAMVSDEDLVREIRRRGLQVQ